MLLVTTSHSLLRVDPESGAIAPIHRGQGLYFGIASDGDRYYVAARGRMVSSEVSQHDERGHILVFDRDFHLREMLPGSWPLRDMHEILWHGGRLWITCSFDNLVTIMDPATGHCEMWHPLGPDPANPFDKNHFNSLAVVDAAMCVLAHNRGPSELLRFDVATRALLAREPFGNQAHNIRVMPNGALMTASSGEGALVATDGWRLDVGGFPRGIVLGDARNYVGISEVAERRERDLTTGIIAVFDKQWRRLRDIALPAEGLLLEIREIES